MHLSNNLRIFVSIKHNSVLILSKMFIYFLVRYMIGISMLEYLSLLLVNVPTLFTLFIIEYHNVGKVSTWNLFIISKNI